MTLPAVPGVIRFDLVFTIGSDSNVRSKFLMHYATVTLTQANLTGAAGQVSTAWGNNMKTQCGPQATLTQVIATDLAQPNFPQGIATASVLGTGGTGSVTAETCLLINFHIARRYRGGKPRIYLPGLGSSLLVDPQHWSPSQVSATTSAWNAFITQVKAYAGPPVMDSQVNVSYIENKVPVGAPVPDTVTSVTCNPIPGSQRRRMNR